MGRTFVALGVALMATCSSAHAACDAGEVWSRTDGRLEIRSYKGPDAITYGSYFFDGRIDGRLAWRVTAEYACSNGIPYCSVTVTVPMSSGDPVQAPETIVGELDAPEYIVFADLAEDIGYIKFHATDPVTVKADIFDVKALASLGDDAEISLPNYLKFARCSKGGGEFEAVSAAAPGEPEGFSGPMPPQPPGPFDGMWRSGAQVCTDRQGDGIPVRVAGSKLKFYEADCDIGKPKVGKLSTTASMACFGEGEEWKLAIELVKKGDQLRISQDGGKPDEYERCPAG